jgi:transcriptional regulator with XRE-family HTH domain
VSPKDDKTPTQQRRAAFGRRLRTLREQAGLTQTALAAAAGLDRSFYNEVETGRHSISVDRAYALADALGVRLACLPFTPERVAAAAQETHQ